LAKIALYFSQPLKTNHLLQYKSWTVGERKYLR